MEQDKENKKIEELSDEQLKKVAGGGFSSECFDKQHDCFEIEDCVQQMSCFKNLNQNGCNVPIPSCGSVTGGL